MSIVRKEHLWCKLLYCCSGMAILLLIYAAVDSSIWVDEAYTMRIIQYSISDLIQITAQDVHPPLYYVIVKLVLDLSGVTDLYKAVVVARFVSLVPYIIMWLLSFTYVRKWFGEMTGALFSICLTTAPQMIVTALEIRMYSWAMLFVFIAFLSIARLVMEEETELFLFIILGISTLCAFYTHYFAAVSVAIILIAGFIYVLIYKRNRVMPFLIMAVADAILYFPWLMVAFKQIKVVSQDYWIQPITKKVLKRYFWYTFQMDESILGIVTGGVFVIVAIACFLVVIFDKKLKKFRLALLGMVVTPLTAAVGVIVSLLMRPVFVERYMIPTNACFWLGFAYLLSACGKRKYVWIFVSTLFLAMTCIQYTDNVKLVKENRVEMEAIESLFCEMGKDDLIVHEYISTELPTAYYCPDSSQYMMEISPTLKTDQIFFDNIKKTMSPQDVMQHIEDGKRVWLFAVTDVMEQNEAWAELISKSHDVGKYMLDYFGFKIFMWN